MPEVNMPTLEVIRFRDVIRIQDIPRFVPDQVAPTLEVVGEDFTSVEQVLLNETTIVTYTILNKNTMWILIPAEMQGELRNLEVVSGNFTKTSAASKVTFSIGTRPKRVEGILRLTQLYTKWLLQSPGSDIWNPQRGGGMQDLVGRLVSINRMDHVLSAMTRSVETTSSQIRTAQANIVGLPLNERLLQATLVDVDRSYERLEARARVHIVSMAGDDALSNLIL